MRHDLSDGDSLIAEETKARFGSTFQSKHPLSSFRPSQVKAQRPQSHFAPLSSTKIHFGPPPIPRPSSGDMDSDILRLWQLVHELSDQLALNQKFTAALQAQAGTLKVQAAHAGSGFALRRYNTDISKEAFESELERTSAQTIIENQTLLYENKQLSLLLKEYEGTMETIMSKFRNHALAAQRHELTLTRHYEMLLQTRETHSMSSDLLTSTETAHVLQRLSHHLRGLLRSLSGAPPDPKDPLYDDPEHDPEHDPSSDSDSESPAPVGVPELEALLDALDPDFDWASDREAEILRLEAENKELRRMLGIDEESMSEKGVVLDPVRDDPSRFAKLVPKRVQDGGDPRMRPGYWDESPQQMQMQMVHHDIGQGQQMFVGQRVLELQAMELQPGMRMGAARGQGRRAGIIGRGRGRGGSGMMMQEQQVWQTPMQPDMWRDHGPGMDPTPHLAHLPPELYECIADFVVDQQSLLALTRSLPYAAIPVHKLFHSICITHPDTVLKLYRRIRAGLDGSTFDAAHLVHHLSVESWTVDAEVLINLMRLLPNLWTLCLWIGPSNFTPEHLEEMFKPAMSSLEYLSLRFRPYVKKATYYQFLKGSYFDSTLLALSAWPPSPKGLPKLSIVQDAFTPDPNDPTPRFAQPIVFFRLDLHLSLLVHSDASQRSLDALRVRIPARPVIQPLTIAYLHPSLPPDSTTSAISPSPPPIHFLDLATCSVSESDAEKLLVRFTALQHLILDGCTSLLRGGAPPEPEWWAAFGRRLVLAGVKRAKDRERELREWYEAQQRMSMPPELLDAENERQTDEPKRVRKGRRGLATATITLRGATTEPPRAGPPPPHASVRRTIASSSSGPSQAGPSIAPVPEDLHEASEREGDSSDNPSAVEEDHQGDSGPALGNPSQSPASTGSKGKKKEPHLSKKKQLALSKRRAAPAPVNVPKPPPPIPKLHIIPPLPTLRSLALFPTYTPNLRTHSALSMPPKTQERARAEFERGWNDGLRVICEIRGRMGATFVRNLEDGEGKKAKQVEAVSKPLFFVFREKRVRRGSEEDEDAEEQEWEREGHEGLRNVRPGEEDVFFRSATGNADKGSPPVLCLAGSDIAEMGHADGCGHLVGSELGLERL
ncbi:hypothetical protein DXG01_012443 [Tephrocybe rancida]|nr:hypothetical protein DXG01_012443 [Tephrocybe rancida]